MTYLIELYVLETKGTNQLLYSYIKKEGGEPFPWRASTLLQNQENTCWKIVKYQRCVSDIEGMKLNGESTNISICQQR
ncbi:hypothetical protein J2S03_003346 [Alicyclobacillus cycloheptanicus]|uniref:Uncharacterized protein n=1 Tax=Alicyclobacillus cycloheptanicus TaxID=1457 RepID=A0ABT9XMG2_9BACL|nr:hypothetical protein [Alicyclobacillus cycloheptanicus]